jgi:hypothetical protein
MKLFKILFFIIKCIEISSQLEYNKITDIVQNLVLEDVDHSLMLNNGFPIYFKCKFIVFNRNYSILFKQTSHFNSNFDHEREKLLYQNYESISNNESTTFDIYKANCALFLNLNSFEIFKNKFQSNFSLFSSEWLLKYNNNKGENLMDRFDILLKIIDESLDSHISIDQSIYKDDGNGNLKKIYKASLDSNQSHSRNFSRNKRKVFNHKNSF